MQKPSSERLSKGTIGNNRYKVIRFVGEGGQKRVYLVKDLNLEINKEIVLKEMKKGDSEEIYLAAMQIFEQEYILLKRLSHKVLPKIYYFFIYQIYQGTFYLIQEFIDGNELNGYLAKGFLSEEQTLEYTLQLAEFLNFLHTRKPPIIFRDMKPSNIIVGKDSNLYIVDMSGALLLGIGSHAKKVKVKTVGYYPPDAANDTPSPDKDIYALGVVLYEMLTRYGVAKSHGKLLPINELRDNISPEVENLLNKLIFFNRQFRIHSAWETELEIEEALRSLRKSRKNTEGKKGALTSLYSFAHRFNTKYIKTTGPSFLLILIAGIPAIPLLGKFFFPEKGYISQFHRQITYYFCIYAFIIYFIWVRALEQVKFLSKTYKLFHERRKFLGGYRIITLLVMLNFIVILLLYTLMIIQII